MEYRNRIICLDWMRRNWPQQFMASKRMYVPLMFPEFASLSLVNFIVDVIISNKLNIKKKILFDF